MYCVAGPFEKPVFECKSSKQPGFVLAVAESQKTVGVKQFNRANYYTGKTVQFSPFDFAQLLRGQLH